MTDDYPPFRLDLGGRDPATPVSMPDAPAELQRERVRGEDEVWPRQRRELERLAVARLQDFEPVLPQVALEEPPRR